MKSGAKLLMGYIQKQMEKDVRSLVMAKDKRKWLVDFRAKEARRKSGELWKQRHAH